MVLTCTHNLCFEKEKKNAFLLKFFDFYNLRKICIVFVMYSRYVEYSCDLRVTNPAGIVRFSVLLGSNSDVKVYDGELCV